MYLYIREKDMVTYSHKMIVIYSRKKGLRFPQNIFSDAFPDYCYMNIYTIYICIYILVKTAWLNGPEK